jgi:hypothetical protein
LILDKKTWNLQSNNERPHPEIRNTRFEPIFKGELSMPSISIQLPAIEADQQIEVEVKINGHKKQYHYRVEIFAWEDCPEPEEEKAHCLKRIIENYDKNWQLIQIGSPTEKTIPIMFRQRN